MALLTIILSIPFLLILPGFFFGKIFFPAVDMLERATLSILLSIATNTVALFLVENIMKKLTPTRSALTVGVVTIICFSLFLLHRRSKHSHS